MFDIAGHLLFANQGYEEMFELTAAVLKQMSSEELGEHTKQYFQEPERFEEMATLLLAQLRRCLKMLRRFTDQNANALPIHSAGS